MGPALALTTIDLDAAAEDLPERRNPDARFILPSGPSRRPIPALLNGLSSLETAFAAE